MEYIICRVCGYIETADNKDKPCPACGFPKTVWAPYTPRKLNDQRRKLLELHLHPVFVHFPISLTAFVAVLPIIAWFSPESFATRLYDVVTLASWVLPILALLGGLTGMYGAKLRYKKMTAPMLKTKIYLSILYFILTLFPCYFAIAQGVSSSNAWYVCIPAILACICAGLLGKMGSHLFATKLGPYVAG